MSIAQIAAALPRGLHDARLQTLAIDWPKGRLRLTVCLKVTQRDDFDRCGRIEIGGLVFCAIDGPEIDAPRQQQPIAREGLWIDAGEGFANEDARSRLPQIPEGCFLHWLFVRDWNRFIHICARTASFEWTELQPVRRRASRVSVDPESHKRPADPLLDIVNTELSAVVFVQDYVQLQFNGPVISALTPITVHDKGVTARSGETNFRNLLCEQVSKTVTSAVANEGDALTIVFADESTIAISLQEHDCTGPEAVVILGVTPSWGVL